MEEVTGAGKCVAASIPGCADGVLVLCMMVEGRGMPVRLLHRGARVELVQMLEATPLPPVWLEDCQGAVAGIVVRGSRMPS